MTHEMTHKLLWRMMYWVLTCGVVAVLFGVFFPESKEQTTASAMGMIVGYGVAVLYAYRLERGDE